MLAPRILLVEDNLILVQDLAEQLATLGYSQLTAVSDTHSAFEAFETQQPDLAIIDIHLTTEKRGGILLAQKMNAARPIPIIYLTGLRSPEVLAQALSTHPANFLLKPYRKEELQAAIALALEQDQTIATEIVEEKRAELTEEYYLLKDCFFAKQKDRYLKVEINDILWVSADNVLVEVQTTKKRYVLSTTLKSFCQQIDHADLIRVHRSFVVNIQHVMAFSEGQLYLPRSPEPKRIPVGPSYRANFFKHIPRLQTK